MRDDVCMVCQGRCRRTDESCTDCELYCTFIVIVSLVFLLLDITNADVWAERAQMPHILKYTVNPFQEKNCLLQ